jgi:hypothetical protein
VICLLFNFFRSLTGASKVCMVVALSQNLFTP